MPFLVWQVSDSRIGSAATTKHIFVVTISDQLALLFTGEGTSALVSCCPSRMIERVMQGAVDFAVVKSILPWRLVSH